MNKFFKNLESYGVGNLLAEVEELQPKIVEAVRETGIQGKLIIELSYRRVGVSGVAVAVKIKPTIPRSPIQPVEMFADENHNLHESNPDQMDFEGVHVIDKNKKINQI